MGVTDHGNIRAHLALMLEIIFGSIIFVIIAGVAVSVGKFVAFLESWGGSEIIVLILTAVEYLLVTVDAICFLSLVIVSAVRLIRRSWMSL
jgi:uncharacterized membrane protein